MIRCKTCNSPVKIILNDYDGDNMKDGIDYAICPNCGRLELDQVYVVMKKHKKGGNKCF